MGLFGGKSDAELLVEPYKMQIDMLKEHIERLEKQTKSPAAYREMKADEAAMSNIQELPAEEKRKRELEHEVKRKWVEHLEAPTFNSFDEFESFLRRQNPPTDEDVASESLHLNSES
jgi:hypothetical protein